MCKQDVESVATTPAALSQGQKSMERNALVC